MPIDALRLPALLVQRHPAWQLGKIKAFLKAGGPVPLIYSTPDSEILVNEEWWLVLKEVGATEVDVAVIHGKSPEELKAIRLAFSRIPQDARWDTENVRLVLKELEIRGIDLSLTGFDQPEIDDYLRVDIAHCNVKETGSDIPPLATAAVAKAGEVWALGPHRAGCGSATDLDFVRQVLAGHKVAVSFTDPHCDLTGDGVKGEGDDRPSPEVVAQDQYFALLRDALIVIRTCSLGTALVYACTDWRHVLQMLAAARTCGMQLYQMVAWVRSNGGIDGLYQNRHRLICVLRAGEYAAAGTVKLRRRGRVRTNVWTYDDVISVPDSAPCLDCTRPQRLLA
jgi:hypothetical protein